jgi:hypothetical protein
MTLSKLLLEALIDEPDDEFFGLDPDWLPEDLDRSDVMMCEACACTEYDACIVEGRPCSWSEYFLMRGRFVCSTCETKMIALGINLDAIKILQSRNFARPS